MRGRPAAIHPKIRRLAAKPILGPDDIDRFIARNRFPVIERKAATFVYRGEADQVWLRRFMQGEPDGLPLTRLERSDLWHLRVPLAPGTRLEYKFDVVQGDSGTWINDPLNPRLATDPFGANSVCHAFGYEVPAWSQPDPATPAGRIEPLVVPSAAFGDERSIQLYLPAGFARDRRYPLLIVHDGLDFVAHAGLATILDNLIHQRRVPPLIAALTQSPDRIPEYTGGSQHEDFVARDLLPFLRANLPVHEGPAGVVLVGASLGAVACLRTVHRHRGTFGGLVLLSGSFIFERGLLEDRDPLFVRIADFVDALKPDPGDLPPRIFVSCGLYEGLSEQNQAIAALLRQAGAEVRYTESRDAHHWQNWRDQMLTALTWTLPDASPVG